MKEKRIIIAMLMCCGMLTSFAQHISYRPFKHYGERVDEFEKAPAITSHDVVMLGNSLTEFGYEWNELLGMPNVVNRGIAGDTNEGIQRRLSQVLPYKPKAIFLMVGMNDLSHGITARQVFDRCRKTIDMILKGSPTSRLYVQSCLPYCESFGRWKALAGKSSEVPRINALLKSYCESKRIIYIDLYPHFLQPGTNQMKVEYSKDGLHLTPAGYSIWVARLKPYMVTLK
ncbi:MAG: serine acetyltransferase [Prevotella sp.]|nr:serine acetyltransferase [Prevotella sp.]